MKTYRVGKPVSPSNNLETILLKAKEILITYGGGMGGANKTYYVTKVNGNEYTLITGEVIKLNKDFIVRERDVKLVKVTTDTTEHSNYRSITCKQSIVVAYHLLEFNQEYVSGEVNESDQNVIYRDLTTI